MQFLQQQSDYLSRISNSQEEKPFASCQFVHSTEQHINLEITFLHSSLAFQKEVEIISAITNVFLAKKSLIDIDFT